VEVQVGEKSVLSHTHFESYSIFREIFWSSSSSISLSVCKQNCGKFDFWKHKVRFRQRTGNGNKHTTNASSGEWRTRNVLFQIRQ